MNHGQPQHPSMYGPQSAITQPGPPTPGAHPGAPPPSAVDNSHLFEPVSSSAFFIRNDETGSELLIFGDLEPDTVSMVPRNHVVWEDAATKFAAGHLKAIFIECSYDDSVRDSDLYGHLCPRHLIAELRFLANCVLNVRKYTGHVLDGTADTPKLPQASDMHLSIADAKRKRKRGPNGELAKTPELGPTDFATPPSPRPLQSPYVGAQSATRRKTSHHSVPEYATPKRTEPTARGRSVQFSGSGPSLNVPSGTAPPPMPPNISTSNLQGSGEPPPKLDDPLKGLNVHIIHVKDTMMDGPSPGEIILKELKAHCAEAGLGVEFDVTSYGQSIWV